MDDCPSLALHLNVVKTSASFGGNPIDNLIRIRDITGLAVNAIGSVDLKAILALLKNNLVDRCRAEVLTWITVFAPTRP